MSKQNNSRATRYLPQVAVATTVVAVLPVVVVWVLLVDGVISSPWVCVALAMVLSFTASIAGSAYWKRRNRAGDILFSELLLWGWLHRFRSERVLANALELLGLGDNQAELLNAERDVEHQAQTLRQMASALDAQDPYTDGHSRRVALHAAMIARKMGLSREEVAKVRTAAAVHDIGKLRIPAEVLNKPGILNPAEFEIVKRHADEGAEIVACMQDAEITAMVHHHHERFDGGGYPGGLVGVQTPTGSRIIAVADTFDALTSARPYRGAIPHKKAIDVILEVSGTQLDPAAVRAFLKCYSGKRAILFWTLVAVSPQRALAWLSGRPAARTSLGSTATSVAMPAVIAALVGAAFGSASTIGRTASPQTMAQVPRVQASSSPVRHGKVHSYDSHQFFVSSRHASTPVRRAVLGIRLNRRRGVGSFGGQSVVGAPGGPSSSTIVAGGRPGSGGRGGGGHGPGSGGSKTTVSGVTIGGPVVVAAPTPAPAGNPAPVSGGPPAGSQPPSSTPSPSPNPGGSTPPGPVSGNGGATGNQGGQGGSPGGGGGGSPGNSGNGGSQGGSSGNPPGPPSGSGGGAGGGSGGSSGGSGGSGSGGNPGQRGPQSKDDCKDDGYSLWGFLNQGLCIAWWEHNHH